MSRYIDADELWKYADNQKDKSIDANDFMRFPYIDIVRCKECKCLKHFEDKEHGEWNTCEKHMIFMNPDDFCSYGERKE